MCYINSVLVSLAEFIHCKQQEKELKELHLVLANRPAHKGSRIRSFEVILLRGNFITYKRVNGIQGILPGLF